MQVSDNDEDNSDDDEALGDKDDQSDFDVKNKWTMRSCSFALTL